MENTYRGETDVLGEVGEVTSPSASSTNQGQPEAQPVQPTAAAPPAPAAPQEAASGTLPFTGSEVLLAVLAGVALLGAGFGLRRLSAGNRSA